MLGMGRLNWVQLPSGRAAKWDTVQQHPPTHVPQQPVHSAVLNPMWPPEATHKGAGFGGFPWGILVSTEARRGSTLLLLKRFITVCRGPQQLSLLF